MRAGSVYTTFTGIYRAGGVVGEQRFHRGTDTFAHAHGSIVWTGFTDDFATTYTGQVGL